MCNKFLPLLKEFCAKIVNSSNLKDHRINKRNPTIVGGILYVIFRGYRHLSFLINADGLCIILICTLL